jgi:hypothetical protein
MNVLAPVPRPVFSWNYELMRKGQEAWLAALAPAWHRRAPSLRRLAAPKAQLSAD